MNKLQTVAIIVGVVIAVGLIGGALMSPSDMPDDVMSDTTQDTMDNVMQDTMSQTEPDMQDAMELPNVVDIGVMLPASGDLSSHGHDSNSAVKLAASDFNEYLEEQGAHWRVNLVVEDTATDPIIALEKIQSLNSKGIKLILGTQSSAELRNIKPYADDHNIILLSPSSTAPALAIDDNIFRLIPDDTKQGVVIAKLLETKGIKVVIPVWRGDVWGDGLQKSSKENFESLGGIVDDGIRYAPDVAVFSTEASLLSETVDRYVAEGHAKDEIGVMMISFAESIQLIQSADRYDNLKEVTWFGSDAASGDDGITGDPIANEFVMQVGLVSTQFAAADTDNFKRVTEHLNELTGSDPNAYAYSAYDSLWILGKTVHHTQSTDPTVIKENLPDVSKDHVGAIGNVVFNEFGDLAISDYSIWSVVDGQWKIIGKYHASSDELSLE